MNLYAQFNGVNYAVEKNIGYKKSSREVVFSFISIDFTNKTISDLPYQFQEVKLIDTDTSKVYFIGYVAEPVFPQFDGQQRKMLLQFELLSPLAYTAKRTVNASFNDVNINIAVVTILSELTNLDGYTIQENNLSTTKYLSDAFISESIENVMNELAYRFNFVWFVDELKKIYLYDLNSLIKKAHDINILDNSVTINGTEYVSYLSYIKPYLKSSEYANKLNFKNFKLISQADLIPINTVLTQGETYDFKYPITMSESAIFKDASSDTIYIFGGDGHIQYANDDYCIYASNLDKSINIGTRIGFSGEDDNDTSKYILLIRSYTDPTVITGFKWNTNTATLTYNSFYTHTSIIDYLATYINPWEINALKVKTNTSGIIENTIDCNGKYFSKKELSTYAEGFFEQNKNEANYIDIGFYGNINDASFIALIDYLKVCNVIKIKYESCFIAENNYIITDFSYTQDIDYINLSIQCRKSNYNETFIDLFRAPSTQYSAEILTKKLFVVYSKDEDTMFKREILVNGDVVND